jgi:DNA-binding CsgD family transcriptional regulator
MVRTRDLVRMLVEAGATKPEIAAQLGLAPTTVEYHLARLKDEDPSSRNGAARPASAAAAIPTRTSVSRLLNAGYTRAATARALGVSKATVSYHARRLGEDIDQRCAIRYDWGAVQRHYDAGNSVRACAAAFGFSSASWFAAVKRGAVVPRPSAMPIDELLVAGTYRGRDYLKLRLLRAGLKSRSCECCGIADWRGEPITLALHHVNGVRNDNRLENLQLLCPNCHSQTDTFAGRNGSRRASPSRHG